MCSWPRLVFALSAGVVLGGVTLTCQMPYTSLCHRNMVEQLGCCPTCDSDCRAAVLRECQNELHEAPAQEPVEADTEVSLDDGDASSSSNG